MDTHTVLGWETDDGLARDWEARQGPSGRVGGPGIPRSPAFPPQEHVRQGGSAGARYPGASTESTRSYPSRVRDPESEGDGRGSGRRSEPNQPDCAEVTGGESGAPGVVSVRARGAPGRNAVGDSKRLAGEARVPPYTGGGEDGALHAGPTATAGRNGSPCAQGASCTGGQCPRPMHSPPSPGP